ncbi:unnamed protein product [Urochloa humidicola]
MSSVFVRKSSAAVTRPLEPVTSGTTIKLTSWDSSLVKVPFTVLLVFDHLSPNATESIKRALSQALVHYSPFAGRISSGPDDDGFNIRCTGEGLEFVAASVDCGLEEAKIFDDSTDTKTLLDELAVYYPVGSYGSVDDPLLSVQVTEFSCGGLVLGVTWSHAISDGFGIAHFLAAVGELARGSSSPSVVPARWDDAVSELLLPFNAIGHAMLVCPESSPDMELTVPFYVTVPSALISHVKDESRRRCCSGDGRPCSTFEAVVAILWRCHVRATMSSPETPVYLTSVVNMRRHVGAKDGYYGNCAVSKLLGAATSGAVASADFVDLVRMFSCAMDQLPEKLKAKEDDQLAMRGLRSRYDVLHVTSWRNIGFEQVDFGSGAPARVMSRGPGGPPPVPACVLYPPCKGKDGVNVHSNSMKQEHVGAFLGELASLACAENSSVD